MSPDNAQARAVPSEFALPFAESLLKGRHGAEEGRPVEGPNVVFIPEEFEQLENLREPRVQFADGVVRSGSAQLESELSQVIELRPQGSEATESSGVVVLEIHVGVDARASAAAPMVHKHAHLGRLVVSERGGVAQALPKSRTDQRGLQLAERLGRMQRHEQHDGNKWDSHFHIFSLGLLQRTEGMGSFVLFPRFQSVVVVPGKRTEFSLEERSQTQHDDGKYQERSIRLFARGSWTRVAALLARPGCEPARNSAPTSAHAEAIGERLRQFLFHLTPVI